MNKLLPVVWLGRIGRHVVTVRGEREVTRREALDLHVAWKKAKAKDGERVAVGDVVVRACRSMA